MRKFLIAAVLVSLTASVGEARCKRFGKGRIRHAVVATASVSVKAVSAAGSCVGGVCFK